MEQMIILKRNRAWNADIKKATIPFPKMVFENMMAQSGSNVTVVAYHTNDTFYTHEAERFRASAERLNIKVDITVVENHGNWIKNTSFKSAFLEMKRREIRGPLLYVDVDAVFHHSPLEYLNNFQCDIAVCHDLEDGHLMSGTLFLNDTQEALDLMKEWNKSCKQRVDVWDQRVLEDILQEDKLLTESKYAVAELPREFCWIFDCKSNLEQNSKKIYIEHLQASRSIKEKEGLKEKFFWLSFRKKSVQRRLDRVKEIESILFSK